MTKSVLTSVSVAVCVRLTSIEITEVEIVVTVSVVMAVVGIICVDGVM